MLTIVRRAKQVDRDHLAEFARRDVEKFAVDGGSGVVDPGVDPAESTHDLLGQRLDRRVVGDVGRDRRRRAAGVFDLPRHVRQRFVIAGGEGDARAHLCRLQRRRAADAARSAGNDDDLICQRLHVAPPRLAICARTPDS
jgi:hypothetical protein